MPSPGSSSRICSWMLSQGSPVQGGHLSRLGGALQSTAQGAVPSLALSLPPRGHLALLPTQPWLGEGHTHLALSLKEMSEVPAGAFRTFWEPEYKTSMPVEGRGVCSGAEPRVGVGSRGLPSPGPESPAEVAGTWDPPCNWCRKWEGQCWRTRPLPCGVRRYCRWAELTRAPVSICLVWKTHTSGVKRWARVGGWRRVEQQMGFSFTSCSARPPGSHTA